MSVVFFFFLLIVEQNFFFLYIHVHGYRLFISRMYACVCVIFFYFLFRSLFVCFTDKMFVHLFVCLFVCCILEFRSLQVETPAGYRRLARVKVILRSSNVRWIDRLYKSMCTIPRIERLPDCT